MVSVAAHRKNDTCPLDWHLLIVCVYATDFESNYIVLSFEVSPSAPPSDYWCSTRALLFAEP